MHCCVQSLLIAPLSSGPWGRQFPSDSWVHWSINKLPSSSPPGFHIELGQNNKHHWILTLILCRALNQVHRSYVGSSLGVESILQGDVNIYYSKISSPNHESVCFVIYLFFFILHTKPNSPSFPFSRPPSSFPTPIHSSEGLRPTLGNQKRLACQVEVGPRFSPLNQGLASLIHHWEWSPKSQFMQLG